MLAAARTIRSPIRVSASLAKRLEITRQAFDNRQEVLVNITGHQRQGFFFPNGILMPPGTPGTLTPPVFINPRISEGK